MERNEKLQIIQKISEKELTKRFLIPLFQEMGFRNVKYNHGTLEYGKDIIYCEETKFRKIKFVGVQVKQGDINTNVAEKIFSQISKGLSPFRDLSDNNKEKNIDEFFVITSGMIKENGRGTLTKLLQGVNINKPLFFIEGNELIDLLDSYMPSVFWEEYDCFCNYFNELKNQFETIKDLSIIGRNEAVQLEEIYVSLKLIENLPEHKILYENKQNFEEKFIIEKTSNEFRITFIGKNSSENEIIFNADDILKKFDRLVIVGAPGSGKTTLLRHFAVKACKENLERNERITVPITIGLKDFADREKSMREYIDFVLEKYNFKISRNFIENDLMEGKCLLLIDGFDELASNEKQNKVKEQIEKFLSTYPKNHVIVTSRKAGYHGELVGFHTLELMEFDDEQIELFIDNWFKKTNPEKTRLIINAIKKSDRILAIARNPLMISIISIIYEEDRQLPQRRVELYNRCIEVVLNRWDVARRINNKYDSKAKEKIIRKFALDSHISNNKTFLKDDLLIKFSEYLPEVNIAKENVEDVLNEIVQRNALLEEISIDSYEFVHLSFQEYLTALELRERKDYNMILKHLYEPWWEEVILLIGGFDRDATDLINKIIKKEMNYTKFKEDIFYSNLIILGKIIADADYTNIELRNKIIENLWNLYQTANFYSLKEKAIDILSLIKPLDLINSQINDLENVDKVIRGNAAEALGKIKTEIAIDSLINTLTNDEVSNVRGSAAAALGNIGNEKAVTPLINILTKDKDSYVQERAATALGNIGNEKATDSLINALKTDINLSVRTTAAFALGGILNEKAIEALIDVLISEENNKIQTVILFILFINNVEIRNKIKISDKTIELLINDFSKYKQDKRNNISFILRISKSEKIIEPLIKMLFNNKENDVRTSAAKLLGDLGGEKGFDPLIKALATEKDNNVRRIIYRALGDVGTEKATEVLIEALTCEKDYKVRDTIVLSLKNVGTEEVIPHLIKTLTEDENSVVQGNAAQALGVIGSKKAIKPLIKTLNTTKENKVQWKIAFALGKLGYDEAINSIIEALTTAEKSHVRIAASNVLEKLGNKKAIKPLINILTTDKDNAVRMKAAEVLGSLGNEKTIEPLLQVLNDKDIDLNVKEELFNSLEKISKKHMKRITIKSTEKINIL